MPISELHCVVTLRPLFAGLFLLYGGPDQILPLASVLGAVIGVLLMFWQRLIRLLRNGWTHGWKVMSDTEKKKQATGSQLSKKDLSSDRKR